MNQLNLSTKNLSLRNCKKKQFSSEFSILDLCNISAVLLIVSAFIFSYNAPHFLGFPLSLFSLIAGMCGLIIINFYSIEFQQKHWETLSIALIIIILSLSLLILKWSNNTIHNRYELLKSSIFYSISLLCLTSFFYSSIFHKIGPLVIKIYRKVLILSSIILIFQSFAFFIFNYKFYFPWQNSILYFYRPSGIFVEPAYFGHFAIGLLFFSRNA